MSTHEKFMWRCIELARAGAGSVAPNPMVGAILVDADNNIVGEGWHKKYGEAHAEPNAIRDALTGMTPMTTLTSTTLYVSLEPCSHYGKTPPCADLIIQNKIPRVVVGCRDPFEKVNGKGIEKLEKAGVEVLNGVLENECKTLNKRFFTFHKKRRPYVILKWAQTADGFIGPDTGMNKAYAKRLLISNEFSNRLVHKWRSEEAAILVGTNTVLMDDPALTTRLWPGHSPVRVIIDKDLRIPSAYKIYDGEVRSIILNRMKEGQEGTNRFVKPAGNSVDHFLASIYESGLQSVIVEGGRKLLQSFIDAGLWDEARVITGASRLSGGLPAPSLTRAQLSEEFSYSTDRIFIYKNIF